MKGDRRKGSIGSDVGGDVNDIQKRPVDDINRFDVTSEGIVTEGSILRRLVELVDMMLKEHQGCEVGEAKLLINRSSDICVYIYMYYIWRFRG